MVRLQINTRPTATDLIPLATAKEFLRVTHSSEDTTIEAMIAGAIDSAQNFTNSNFLSHTYTMYLQSWSDVYVNNTYNGYLYRDIETNLNTVNGGYFSPYTGLAQFVIPNPPLRAITHIKYYDNTNTQQTYSATNYTMFSFINQKGFVEINKDVNLPSLYERADAVEIKFTTGFGNSSGDVPAAIKQAILLIIGKLYELREDSVSRLPKASEYLLEPYRIKTY